MGSLTEFGTVAHKICLTGVTATHSGCVFVAGLDDTPELGTRMGQRAGEAAVAQVPEPPEAASPTSGRRPQYEGKAERLQRSLRQIYLCQPGSSPSDSVRSQSHVVQDHELGRNRC